MEKKRRIEIEELTKVFNEMLRVSKQYSYLWDEGFVDNSINVARGFIAQDETFSINVSKYGNKFKINGKNFDYYDKNGLSARQAALRIKEDFSTFSGLEADSLKESFYSSLKKSLGKYLAEKALEKIKFGVL